MSPKREISLISVALGLELDAAIQASGKSRADIANAVDIHGSYLGAILTAQKPASLALYEKIADAIGIQLRIEVVTPEEGDWRDQINWKLEDIRAMLRKMEQEKE